MGGSLIVTALAIATFGGPPAVRAQTFSGDQGKDFDVISFTVSDGQAATVTITAQGKNSFDGNWTGIDYWINGASALGPGDMHDKLDYADHTKLTIVIRSPGQYVVAAACPNYHETVDTCDIEADGVSFVHITPHPKS